MQFQHCVINNSNSIFSSLIIFNDCLFIQVEDWGTPGYSIQVSAANKDAEKGDPAELLFEVLGATEELETFDPATFRLTSKSLGAGLIWANPGTIIHLITDILSEI